MVSSTICRLIFFGGRYISMLLIAKLLEVDSSSYLITIAIVDFSRVLFDYGLENAILARYHQRSVLENVLHGKATFRLLSIICGQLVTSGFVFLFCFYHGASFYIPLIASFQFTVLMIFGYIQANFQTDNTARMSVLVQPLVFSLILQCLLFLLVVYKFIPLVFCVVSFDLMAVISIFFVAFSFKNISMLKPIKLGFLCSCMNWSMLRETIKCIAPLGNVALLGVVYSRIDAFAVSLVSEGYVLMQYLIYQRIASAPLMFFSTIASVSIAKLSSGSSSLLGEIKQKKFRVYAYFFGGGCGLSLIFFSPLINDFFSLKVVDLKLLFLQGFVLSLQIVNGFHAAILIASHKTKDLWSIALNNVLLALMIMPLLAWHFGCEGVALVFCLIEIGCTLQYLTKFKKNQIAQGELS